MDTRKPLVSFILAYYNLPVQMLCECIDSILALSLTADEREIIVVDDGSKTNCKESLKKYDEAITYIYKPNGGISTARNVGIEAAHGCYIQFVDGDDYLISASYQHCLDILLANHVDIVAFDFTRQAVSPIVICDTPVMSGPAFMCNYNLYGSACCMLFRKSLLGTLRFTPGIRFGEDEEFTPQLILRAGTIIRTNSQAYYYRPNPDSVTRMLNEEAIRKKIQDNQTVLFHLHDLSKSLDQEKRSALNRRIAQLTMDYLYNLMILRQPTGMLFSAVAQLRSRGLYPLPCEKYSVKYTWFRRLSKSPIGLIILRHILPFMKRER